VQLCSFALEDLSFHLLHFCISSARLIFIISALYEDVIDSFRILFFQLKFLVILFQVLSTAGDDDLCSDIYFNML
jgi:hypothetical protein